MSVLHVPDSIRAHVGQSATDRRFAIRSYSVIRPSVVPDNRLQTKVAT